MSPHNALGGSELDFWGGSEFSILVDFGQIVIFHQKPEKSAKNDFFANRAREPARGVLNSKKTDSGPVLAIWAGVRRILILARFSRILLIFKISKFSPKN